MSTFMTEMMPACLFTAMFMLAQFIWPRFDRWLEEIP